ncbi:hypothetical protein CEXT_442181, partial [Caerostris extrusa]
MIWMAMLLKITGGHAAKDDLDG